MKFTKTPLTVEEQLDLLKSRGLIIENENRALHYLRRIGYYRLSSYCIPFKIKGDPNDSFKENASFNKVLNLYIFDRELRILIFDKIEKIEIAFRSSIMNHMSTKYGSHWYTDKKLFADWYDHKKLMSEVEKLVKGSNELFIKHYKKKYTFPKLPPSWMTFELLSFGQIYNIFNALPNEDKKAISSEYNLHYKIFLSWFLTINVIRNTCAHHSRLWNRELGVKAKFPKIPLATVPFNNDRLYSILFIIKYLLNTITPASNFKNQLIELFKLSPIKPKLSSGIPEKWFDDPIWKSPTKSY